MARSTSVVAVGALTLVLLSGVFAALPAASAITTVQDSMPAGAGNGPASAPGFAPAALTLVIGVNNTVTWTNNDSPSHHDVASTSVPSGASAIASPDMPPGATFTYTFTVPGTYQIVCTYHSWMMMTVVVTGSSTTSTPEFPAAWLAVILFAVIATVMVAAPRVRPGLAVKPN